MPGEVLIVLSTFADADSARKVSQTLVDERLVACANLLTGVESIYRWKNNVETSAEVLVIFKTTRECYTRLEQRLRAMHPYEVPEIVALEPAQGSAPYLEWVIEACSHSASSIS